MPSESQTAVRFVRRQAAIKIMREHGIPQWEATTAAEAMKEAGLFEPRTLRRTPPGTPKPKVHVKSRPKRQKAAVRS
jgi:hypothetical protein